MTGLAIFAVVKTLTVLGGGESFSEEALPTEVSVFERADSILAAQNGRRAKWERYLELTGQRESRPSISAVRYRLSAGKRIYSFTIYGRLFADGRYVRDDEIGAILELEKIFREMHSRSAWNGEKLRDFRAEPLALRGFEEPRFLELDAAIKKTVAEFNSKRMPTVHELSSRLFKSFIVEETYWRSDKVSEDDIRAGLARLVAAGMRPNGKSFRGWHAAIQAIHGADFAERVVSRADNPEIFTPAMIWKEKGK
jgi:hypothetical protein